MRMTTRGAWAILIGLAFYSPAPLRAATVAPLRLVAPADRVQGEPDRHRRRASRASAGSSRPRAAACASRPTRFAWRGPRPRTCARPRPRVGLGPRDVRRVDPPRLRGPAAASGPALLLAGPRLGRRGHGLRLERAGLLGDGPARAVRLEGELDRARTCRTTSKSPGPRRMLRREFTLSGAVERGAGLRHEPRPLRAAPERPARRATSSSRPAGPATTSACSTRPTT